MYSDVCVYFVLWTHPSDSLCCINGTCGSRFAMVQLPLFVCWNIKGVVLGFSVMALPSLGLLLYMLCKRFLFVLLFSISGNFWSPCFCSLLDSLSEASFLFVISANSPEWFVQLSNAMLSFRRFDWSGIGEHISTAILCFVNLL